jgi:hypothetical protein
LKYRLLKVSEWKPGSQQPWEGRNQRAQFCPLQKPFVENYNLKKVNVSVLVPVELM